MLDNSNADIINHLNYIIRGHTVTEEYFQENIRKAIEEIQLLRARIKELEINDHLAFYDDLTELPNRRLIRDRIAHSIEKIARTDKRGALLFIDLDYFSTVNNTFGHEAGDLVLRTTASRIKHCIRKEDTAARLGGDEFLVLIEDLNKDDIAVYIAEKILNEIQQPIEIYGTKYQITASIGISFYWNGGNTVDKLLKRSDAALYEAKETGRNSICFYRPREIS